MTDNTITAAGDGKVLSPEDARKMREKLLRQNEENAPPGDAESDETDSVDSTLATLILPGG